RGRHRGGGRGGGGGARGRHRGGGRGGGGGARSRHRGGGGRGGCSGRRARRRGRRRRVAEIGEQITDAGAPFDDVPDGTLVHQGGHAVVARLGLELHEATLRLVASTGVLVHRLREAVVRVRIRRLQRRLGLLVALEDALQQLGGALLL